MMIETLTRPAVRFEPPPFILADPDLVRLVDYWHAIRHGRPVPLRRDFDPIDIPFILGRVILAERRESPRCWFVRVHGTEIARRIGYELTGKTLNHLPTEYRADAVARFEEVSRTGLPHRTVTELTRDNRTLRYEAVLLPMSRDGSAIDMLLSGVHFFSGEENPVPAENPSIHQVDAI